MNAYQTFYRKYYFFYTYTNGKIYTIVDVLCRARVQLVRYKFMRNMNDFQSDDYIVLIALYFTRPNL